MKHLVLDQILHELLAGPNSNAAHSFKYDFKHAGMDERYYNSSTSFTSPVSSLKFIYDCEESGVSRSFHTQVYWFGRPSYVPKLIKN